MRNTFTLTMLAIAFWACETTTDTATDTLSPSRLEWEYERLKDPATGEIPANIRARELSFAQRLPASEPAARSGAGDWIAPIGPYNVGGRTRAFSMDINNPEILLAGGVSGGMWRSTDGGNTWKMTSSPGDLRSVTCIAQDKRAGKSHIWYYGSGEGRGNSAGRSFSAFYEGDGIFTSQDSGKTWHPLPSTASNTPQTTNNFDRMWNIAVDHSVDTATVLYAATYKHIMRSADGGQTWDSVRGGRSSGADDSYTDILITPRGDKYATLGSSLLHKGIWRSTDGINWQNINPPFITNNYNRIVMSVNPQNENSVFFFGNTPGGGQSSSPPGLGGEYNSLWKYTYNSSGGNWENLSAALPQDSSNRRNLYTQGCYDMCIAVSPHDSDFIVIGGQNIFRNTAGWRTADSSFQMGGYNPASKNTWDYRYENSHPDFHVILFHPLLPNVLYTASDGGIHRTDAPRAQPVVWTDKSLGYTTSQFYTVSVDRHNSGSNIVLGGMQDNSTFWSNASSPIATWKMLNLGDGAYCAVASDQETYYTSRQYASIIKEEVDNQGNVLGFTRIDPQTNAFYSFINPFELDPQNDNTMFLGMRGRVMRNTTLNAYALDSSNDRKTSGWSNIPLNGFPTGAYVTALHRPRISGDYLYIGTNLKQFFRVTSPAAVPTITFNGSAGFLTGGYVSSITTHPDDPMKVMVSFSNYGVHSIWYSDNGGDTWTPVAGNLEAPQPVGSPPGTGLGDGPSVRAVQIVKVSDGVVYLAGTSVGLFATASLDGINTEWIRQSPEGIGSAVVEAIDSRPSDGFTAVATHGNGVFAGYLQKKADVDQRIEPVGAGETKPNLLQIFPNPTSNYISIQSTEKISKIGVYSLNGILLKSISEPKGTTIFVGDVPRQTVIVVVSNIKGESGVRKVLLH
jgi:hypothetical protein